MLGISAAESIKTSDGCSISFRLRPAIEPGAPRLALIHSLALDGSVWSRVGERLEGRVNVLTYDCRGHGRSSKEAKPFTTDMFAQDLAELLDHVRWPTATVAGCSMGGCVAQAFAGRYPHRLDGLGLINTTAWYGADAFKNWENRAKMARTEGLAAMVEFQSNRWFGDGFRKRNPELVSAVEKTFQSNDVECYVATCRMMGQADLRPFQNAIHVPVAVVVGEEDYATPVAMAQQIHDALPGSTLRILSGVRHLSPVEAPDEISSQLLTLLNRVMTAEQLPIK